MKKFFILFLTLNFFLSVFYIDLWSNSNTTSRALPIISFFENGTFQIDKYEKFTEDKSFIGNHYYTDKAPLPTYFVLPFFGFLKWTGLIQEHNGSLYGTRVYALGTILCSVIPFVLILFLTFRKIYKTSKFSPVLLSILPFYGSFIFIFAGTYFNHIISALFSLLSYCYLKEKKYFVAGIFAGLSFLCEYIVALVIAIWALQVLLNERSFKQAMKFTAGVLPSVVLIMIYNYCFTGSPFIMLYKFHTYEALHSNYGFSHPTPESLWGLVFSQYKGLLFYAPFLICIIIYVVLKFRKTPVREILGSVLSNYLIIASIAVIVLVSSYFGWWGGWTYGPRLILFIAVLLLYEGILFLSKQDFSKIFFWIPVIFGILCTFLDKATLLYSIPSEVKFPFSDMIIPQFFSWQLNSNNLFSLFFGTHTLFSFLIWCILFITFVILMTVIFRKSYKCADIL
ncbi:MAG: hypothetical protein HY958_00095 [Bacteroidia bacterium]|nr:hypothetical protein [Bacteroidia bacterium]